MKFANYMSSDSRIHVMPLGILPESYADVDLSPQAAEPREQKSRLLAAVENLPSLAAAYGWCDRLQPISYERAIAFVLALPLNRMLPKVSADEDGDILLVWGDPDISIALTIESFHLHLSVLPGENSSHYGPVVFAGRHIPPVILEKIPVR